ncbi:hypothetical protein PSN45_004195 [Yamadazyma tenuis]|uniref:General substrate transporter n=1 Tax=Candida tenuis (strain ATCC 10573 / BCRC 21748 / CBS 615 / JCM 9827 / NBRC 10315 / NRRL Y-1498 / VKM Y-70) TaxID=590646 RepID=G3B3U8_CANTC|nr:general substrate transporter [Yamadazyma tenuis ATCC 10573]EGV63739.1 general substrate transporter [Yamadazyma tenuis ATCC 10573]WEJ96653.1 hypothetical protein PSN45_004195 [Yamadazyma tenuis]
MFKINKEARKSTSGHIDEILTLPNNTAPIWYKDPGLRKLQVWIFVVFFSQICTGFDASNTSNLQAFASWKTMLGNPDSSQLGIITSIYFMGCLAGSIPCGMFADRFGRKLGLLLGQVLTVIGAAIQASSYTYAQYLCARFIMGVGIASITNSGPAMLFELAHPRMKGTLVSLFNPFWYVGSIVCAATAFGTTHMSVTNSMGWRIPSFIQGVFPLVCIPFTIFMPESPSYLIVRGKKEQALATLAKYHSNGDLNDPLVLKEVDDIEVAILNSKDTQSYKQILSHKPHRKRFMVITIMTLMALWSGQSIITFYFTSILELVGINNPSKQTGINTGLNVMNLVSSVLGAYVSARVGRRPMWMLSIIGMIVVNIPFTALTAEYAKTNSVNVAYGVIVMLFLYDFSYNIACNPLLYSYTTELLPFSIRAKGLAWKNLVGQVALIINMYVNPIALAKITWKYYIFYMCLNLVWLTLVYFLFPETLGLTLEELSRLFEEDRLGSIGDIESDGVDQIHVTELGKK